VTPLYFGSMAWEHRTLQRRVLTADSEETPAANYTKPDTIASLGMGLLSLTTPLTMALVRRAVPRRGTKGRIGRVIVAVAVTSAVATTIADVVGARADSATDAGRRVRARARKVARVGGVAAIASVGLTVSATATFLTGAKRQWAKGEKRDLGKGVVGWTVAMVGWDFIYYWNHRLMHEVRALWAIHVPHHSSEHYNLSTALRQPVAGALGVFVPYGALARLGVRPNMIETSRALNLIYQYWIHTDTVRLIAPMEPALNTPSNHRVHHGSNKVYLDRNHGGILIIWDKLFGTFQRELPKDDPVVYGLTRNIKSHNLATVSVHEYRDMFGDVARSTNWRDRLGFVLRGPGWAYDRRDELAAAELAAAAD
jgi:sterol desaturase/sphingolipid hydroxylase (fatty acid hydroxylase superfamily)